MYVRMYVCMYVCAHILYMILGYSVCGIPVQNGVLSDGHHAF